MGEACTAANRFFVHRAVADEFAARLAEWMGALIMGPGMRRGVEVGPLVDRAGPRDLVVRPARPAAGWAARRGSGRVGNRRRRGPARGGRRRPPGRPRLCIGGGQFGGCIRCARRLRFKAEFCD
ncbi:aldehyde dehydrogenase family protein [Micromonospora sp. KC207]|uniref:aldehyde dehydrogenase family protein n=1 Tax=Micromonospora sp. KC207 TaxID=2530377 RepID=UPI001FB70F12|nr:aldehyde dehydrogenase family protein [Micromonospora sp. KC207]